MSVPHKYRSIGDFHEYYSGKRTAPYLTLFVGGNHEASSHLRELYYGGWVAPNIYYLGAANVLRFGDLRIAGLSGIWKGYNYNKPHFERLPYDADDVKSAYHVREVDVRKLLLLRDQVDVGLSHDWPRGVEWKGDHQALFRKKDLFEADAKAGKLGSSAARYVMDRLRPPHWFAAHLHCKFAAVVDYSQEEADGQSRKGTDINGSLDGANEAPGVDAATGATRAAPSAPVKNSDEIDLDLDMDDEADDPTSAPPTETIAEQNLASPTANPTENQPSTAPSTDLTTQPPPTDHKPHPTSSIPDSLRARLPASFTRPASPPPVVHLPHPPTITNKLTNFLALDKCLPHRNFLQILDISPLHPATPPSPLKLRYDPEWLSILRIFGPHDPHAPSPRNLGEAAYIPLIAKEREWVDEHLLAASEKEGEDNDGLEVPLNFETTAPPYDGADIRSVGMEQPREYSNPQTSRFCEMLGIKNWFDNTEEEREEFRRRKGEAIESKGGEERQWGGGRGRGAGGRGGGGGRGRGGGGGRGGRGRGRGRGWR